MPEVRHEDDFEIFDGNEVWKAALIVHLGEGTTGGGEKFDLSQTLNGAPIIDFEDGYQVIFNWRELVSEAWELKENVKKGRMRTINKNFEVVHDHCGKYGIQGAERS